MLAGTRKSKKNSSGWGLLVGLDNSKLTRFNFQKGLGSLKFDITILGANWITSKSINGWLECPANEAITVTFRANFQVYVSADRVIKALAR